MTQPDICFNRASAIELRIAALRQLAFEEPVSRMARLKKTVGRQLARNEKDKVKELSPMALADLHGAIFGPAVTADLVFSLALLLEDFRIYSKTAFSSFGFSETNISSSCHPSDGRGRLCVGLSERLSLPPSQSFWLEFCLRATINWSALLSRTSQDSDGDGDGDRDLTESELPPGLPYLLQSARTECGEISPLDHGAVLAAAGKLAESMRQLLKPSLVVLVEGQSELIVLPHFARLSGKPLEDIGAAVIASGGAPQVARRYLTMKDVLKIPIVCVLDGDAEESSTIIEEALRDMDGLVCLQATELEDCYSYEQLLKILNRQLMGSGQTLSSNAFVIPRLGPRKAALNKLFRERGLGDFDKIAFARSTVDLAIAGEDVPVDMIRVIDYVAAKAKNNG